MLSSRAHAISVDIVHSAFESRSAMTGDQCMDAVGVLSCGGGAAHDCVYSQATPLAKPFSDIEQSQRRTYPTRLLVPCTSAFVARRQTVRRHFFSSSHVRQQLTKVSGSSG